MLLNKKLLILDMNGTFVFNHDRFSKDEDYSIYYKENGGTLAKEKINQVIDEIFDYMIQKYTNQEDFKTFPTILEVIDSLYEDEFSKEEIKLIVDTFTFHELGIIPSEYKKVLITLSKNYELALFSDIWAPQDVFIEMLKKEGIYKLFSFISYSSSIGIIKPSKKPIENILFSLKKTKEESLVIGDSINKDLGSALLSKIDCILVGEHKDDKALASFSNLLEFADSLEIYK